VEPHKSGIVGGATNQNRVVSHINQNVGEPHKSGNRVGEPHESGTVWVEPHEPGIVWVSQET
jgi:hypothetical protein